MTAPFIIIASAIGIATLGLAAGALLFCERAVVRAFAALDARGYIESKQALDRFADPMMPTLVVAATLSQFVTAITTAASTIALVAGGLCAAACVLTVAVNVPINRAMRTWSASAPPPDWQAVRLRWARAHRVRTLLVLAAFLLVLLKDTALTA